MNTVDLIYKVELLENLVESQGKTLEIDNEIIAIKNRLIELNEQEIVLRKKEAHTLKIFCAVLFVIIACLLVSEILSLP